MEPLNYRTYDRVTDTEHKLPASNLPLRTALNTTGREVRLRVNQYKVTQFPNIDVYQYDINYGEVESKRGKIMKLWHSKAIQSKLTSYTKGMPWLWDGNKLAWCSVKLDSELKIMVDLDAEQGRTPGPNRAPDKVLVHIRPSKIIRMAVIDAYLKKQIAFDNSVLECINFLDHAMRVWPTSKFCSIKRSYFSRDRNTAFTFPNDGVIMAMRGVYTSIRLCSPNPSIGGGPGTGLALNCDISNKTFWIAQDVHQCARNFLRDRNPRKDPHIFQRNLKPVRDGQGYTWSPDFKELRKLHKLKFTVKYRGNPNRENKVYTIKQFTFPPRGKQDATYAEGAHAKNTTFTMKDREKNTETEISVYDYFKKKHGINLDFWMLPLIETTRDGLFPMEVAILVPDQEYKYKLNPEQTSHMIRFAVSRPRERTAAIERGIDMLKWAEDPYLKHYGIQINTEMTETVGRLLPPPEVAYRGARASPGTTGRWDLRGKKFFLPNTEPLRSWGVCVVDNCTDKATVQNFLRVFIQIYQGHGGNVANREPHIYISPAGEDLAIAATNARQAAGDQARLKPQIMVFILPTRNSFTYERLKKSMDCRYGTASQMMSLAHVRTAQPQYCSNVCMKFNAKLGGTSCKAESRPVQPFFTVPTMIIGADVSHASPGSPQASMAALTMSLDKDAIRFAAAVQTNGYRVEMISDSNVKSMMIPLVEMWIRKVGNGQGPQVIYYYRDGVSEGQFSQVIDQEVESMKKHLSAKWPAFARTKWVVVICAKRHHIRLFPRANDMVAGDRNANPLPGTLVERDVTHPFENDFYLNSHSAIQGTARPTHYQVILDEVGVKVNELHRMTYNMCYQYMRSTTPVSLFPAVYYAHLASNRARAHENVASSEGPRGGQKYEENRQDRGIASRTVTSFPAEAPILLPLGDPETEHPLRFGMWYI